MATILRPVHLVCLVLFIVLQFSLWVGVGSIAQLRQIGDQIDRQRQANALLKNRNDALSAEVVALQRDSGRGKLEAVEGMARLELGMVGKGETFFYMPD